MSANKRSQKRLRETIKKISRIFSTSKPSSVNKTKMMRWHRLREPRRESQIIRRPIDVTMIRRIRIMVLPKKLTWSCRELLGRNPTARTTSTKLKTNLIVI